MQRKRVRSHARVASRRQSRVRMLDRDLWLVFKPKGHCEAPHCHAYPISIRVLRGCLEVRTSKGKRRLRSPGRAMVIAAETWHATEATEDTWLVVERGVGGSSASGVPRSRSSLK